MSRLLDDDGYVYRPGVFGSGWQRQEGILGTPRDTDFFGRPNIKRDIFGQPVQARSGFGTPVYSDDGRPLYEPIESSTTGGTSAGGGDALAGLLAIGIVILVAIALSALFARLFSLIKSIVRGYQELIRRYPTPMVVFHLLIGMYIVGYVLSLAGLPLYQQLGGALLLPLIWGWYRLTRGWPRVFMPINCMLLGAGLWYVAESERSTWEMGWGRLTYGIPLLGNLPLALAILPLLIWLWALGAQHYPWVFFFLGRLVVGSLLWFGLMRVWTDWQPYWNSFIEPLPLVPRLTGWLIVLLPLTLWLWGRGQDRWPLPFTGFNLLLFGGLLGLTAHHTRASWIGVWQHWMEGLPFLSWPVLTITLAPVAFWAWGLAVNSWRRWLAIPNALLTGGILWLIVDRTRSIWETPWSFFWGSVPLVFDPALVLLFIPLAIWLWRKGATRWPENWGLARALLWGGMIWWLAERTQIYWAATWELFSGSDDLYFPGIISLSVPGAWVWKRLSQRWVVPFRVLTWLAVTLLLYWFLGRFFPLARPVLRVCVALLPLLGYGWLVLLRRHPLIALGVICVPVAAAGLIFYFYPTWLKDLFSAAFAWFAPQTVPFWNLPLEIF